MEEYVGPSGGVIVHNHQCQQQPQKRPVVYGPGPYIGGAFGGYNGPESLSIPQQSIQKQRESHGRAMALLNRTNDSLSSSLMNTTALEKSVSAAGEKFIFMQKLRHFVSVLCEFLQGCESTEMYEYEE